MRPTWEDLKREYATTDISLHGLEKKHGIPFSTIKRHSTRDGWVEARESYRHKVAQKVMEKSVSTAVKHEMTRREAYERSLDLLFQRTLNALEDDFSTNTHGHIDASKLVQMWRSLETARAQLGDQAPTTDTPVIIIPSMDAIRTENKTTETTDGE